MVYIQTTSKLLLGIGKYRVDLFNDIGKVWDNNHDICYQVGVGVGLSRYGDGIAELSFNVTYWQKKSFVSIKRNTYINLNVNLILI